MNMLSCENTAVKRRAFASVHIRGGWKLVIIGVGSKFGVQRSCCVARSAAMRMEIYSAARRLEAGNHRRRKQIWSAEAMLCRAKRC